MSKGFYISLLVGILLFLLLFWYSTKTFYEKFETTTDTTSTTASTSTGSGGTFELVSSLDTILNSLKNATAPNTFQYVEDYALIPNKENLKIYLSSFSDKTNYNNKQSIYEPQSQKWNNYLTNEEAFLIVSTDALPATIKAPAGLSIKNKTLNGIRSDLINQSDYILGSFSVSFFLKFNNIVFDETNTIELLDIYVETPNYVRVFLEPIANDTDNVNLIIHIGGSENRYDIKVSKDTLKSNGSPVLLTVVYNADATPKPQVLCFLGETAYQISMTPAPTIYLGNSRVRINGSGKLDATLHAFMFYKSAITQDTQKSLKAYLEKQQSGISDILTKITQLTEEQIKQVRSLVSNQTMTLEELKKQLETCQATATETPATTPEFKYKIGMQGTSPITAEDLASCSVLKVNARGSATTASTTSGTENVGIGTTSTEPFQIDIPFLRNIIGKEADLSKVEKGYFTRGE